MKLKRVYTWSLFLGLFFSLPLKGTGFVSGISLWPAGALFQKTGQTEGAQAQSPPSILDKLKFSGTVRGDFRLMRYGDVTDVNSKSSTDLYLRSVEFAVETNLSSWASAIVVLNSEWIGDYQHPGDSTVVVDEAHIDLELPQLPLYLVLGKRDQPFGLFENYLIADPLTMAAYETKTVGLTLGYRGPLGLDLAFSLYKGQVQMSQLFQADVFDAQFLQVVPADITRVNSVILSASASPSSKYLYIYGAYLSEPGSDRRNRTVNLGFDLTAPFLENLKLDAEYMKALERETYQGQSRSFKEGAFSMTAVYLFVIGHRKHRGTGNYRGRRAQIAAYPFEIAARYEFFDDDSISETMGIWSAKNRLSLGGRYTFHAGGKIQAYFGLEWRHLGYRVPGALRDSMHAQNDEFYLRLGIDF